MPTLQIFTNVSTGAIPADFVKEVTEAWQKMIDKPMKYICVHVVPNQMMSFAGTTDPCAYINVMSIGKIGREENKKYTEKVTEIMSSIGVSKDRMYIDFKDAARENIGYNGTTFAQ